MMIFALLLAITTTLEFEDAREAATRAAVSNEVAAAVLDVNGYTDTSVSNLEARVETALAGKQSTIDDLSDIRAGAALGATALQSYTETDPTIYSWAKASTKPSYAYSEISNTPELGVYATTGQVAQALSGKLDNSGNQTLDGTLSVTQLTVGKYYPVFSAMEDFDGAYATICGKWSFENTYGSRISCQDGMDIKYVAFLSDINLATNALDTAISGRGYLTQHQSLTNYFTKGESDGRYLQSYTEIDPNAAGIASNVVTTAYIREKLGVYLYIGEDNGIYVHTPSNEE